MEPPAKPHFDNFQEQAAYYLDTFCLDWRNYENPKSHMIPRIFDYKWPEINNETVERLKNDQEATTILKSNQLNPVLSDRLGDEAEHLMYKAICQAIDDGISAPFLAIHNLKIDENRKKLLERILPNIQWSTLEFDFLLIGPKIGIVIIEVKSSYFSNRKDFSNENYFLPHKYETGLNQLENIYSFLNKIQESISLPLDNNMPLEKIIRKILFTPNLDQTKFTNWQTNLPEDILCKPWFKKLDSIEKIFKNDQHTNEDQKYLSIFEKVKILLQRDSFEMNREIFEIYAKMISGISSMISLVSTKEGIDQSIEFDEAIYSKRLAIRLETLRISHHQPVKDKGECHKDSLLIPTFKNRKIKSFFRLMTIMFLTPMQQMVLKRGNRQFILGYAGTGKTVLLQAKALKLLEQGESVVVFASGWFRFQYKNLFDNHGLTNYQIIDWNIFVKELIKSENSSPNEIINAATTSGVSNGSETILKLLNEGQFGDLFKIDSKMFAKLQRWQNLFARDHIIYDDMNYLAGGTNVGEEIGIWLTLFALGRVADDPNRTVWFAIHPVMYTQSIFTPAFKIFAELYNFTLTEHYHVMRCSEEVYRVTYPPRDLSTNEPLFPDSVYYHSTNTDMCHKVQGVKPKCLKEHLPTEEAVWINLSNKLPELIREIFGPNPRDLNNFIGVVFTHDDQAVTNLHMNISLVEAKLSQYGIQALTINDRKWEKAFISPLLSAKDIIPDFNNSVMIDHSRLVPSCEWPVVIHVVISSTNSMKDETKLRHEHYIHQARSRAITTFIELDYTYG